jgi:hypothetical protein
MGVKFKAFRWADSSRTTFSQFCTLVFERTLGFTWLQLPNLLVTVPCTSGLFVLEGRDILGTFLLEKCRAKIITIVIIIRVITDKQNKYQELANEICAMWKQNALQMIPIVISSTGVIPESLSQCLKRLTRFQIHIYKRKNL